MPLWTVHHPVDTYTDDDKQGFARDITGIYTRIGLPAFYAVVVFEEHPRGSLFIGGEPATRAVRIAVEHIAVHADEPEQRAGIRGSLAATIEPWTTQRGLYWEFHVDETPRELWMVDGHDPPPFGSEQEATWARENRPVPL